MTEEAVEQVAKRRALEIAKREGPSAGVALLGAALVWLATALLFAPLALLSPYAFVLSPLIGALALLTILYFLLRAARSFWRLSEAGASILAFRIGRATGSAELESVDRIARALQPMAFFALVLICYAFLFGYIAMIHPALSAVALVALFLLFVFLLFRLLRAVSPEIERVVKAKVEEAEKRS